MLNLKLKIFKIIIDLIFVSYITKNLYLPLNENYSLKNREMHVQYADTVKPGNDTVFSLIQQDKNITAIEISERLNLSLSTVKRKIKSLKEQGIIERIGSDKTGYWKII